MTPTVRIQRGGRSSFAERSPRENGAGHMASVWLHSALWIGLALLASLISIRVTISVALIEIVVGAFAGNPVRLQITDWVNFLAGFSCRVGCGSSPSRS
jgi:hypothetical protein